MLDATGPQPDLTAEASQAIDEAAQRELNALMRLTDGVMYVPTPTAARLIGKSPRTLTDERYNGEGIPFIRVSARCIRYSLLDIARYMVRRRFSSTTQADQAEPATT